MKKTHPVDDGTQVEGGNQKMPVMGYEDNESDFDQKWKAYLGEDGWLYMKGLAQEAVRQGAEADKNDKFVKDLVQLLLEINPDHNILEKLRQRAEAAILAEEKAATEKATAAVKKATVEKDTEEAKLRAKADAEAGEEIYANLSDPTNAVFTTVSKASFPTGSNANPTKENSSGSNYCSNRNPTQNNPVQPSTNPEDTNLVEDVILVNGVHQKSGSAWKSGPAQELGPAQESGPARKSGPAQESGPAGKSGTIASTDTSTKSGSNTSTHASPNASASIGRDASSTKGADGSTKDADGSIASTNTSTVSGSNTGTNAILPTGSNTNSTKDTSVDTSLAGLSDGFNAKENNVKVYRDAVDRDAADRDAVDRHAVDRDAADTRVPSNLVGLSNGGLL